MLIGRGAQWTDGTRISERRNLAVQQKPAPLITRDLIVGARERVDSAGRILRPLDEEDVRRKLRKLVDKKVIHGHERVVVISTAHGLKFADQKISYHAGMLEGIQGTQSNRPVEVSADPKKISDAISRYVERVRLLEH